MNQSQIEPSLKSFLEGFKGFRRSTEGNRTQCSIRVSHKQLWLIAYRAKEITGSGFSCQGPLGTMPYPVSIPIGCWEDGSTVSAQGSENKINGPFWLKYTESFESI